MSMGIVVRDASLADAGAFLDLIDSLADYEHLPRPTLEARERLLRDGFGDNARFHPYLAELDGVPVAYAITLSTYSSFLALPTLFLEDLFVRPEDRGKGVGRAIFRYLARKALDEGCGRMEWMVLDWNDLALGFYNAVGGRRLTDWLPFRMDRAALVRLESGDD
jgi:GNAT superfamily N-acetyltransferase